MTRTVRYYVNKQAEDQPDRIYLFAPEPNATLTYRELRQCCVDLGKQLVRRGFRKGEKVSFMMGNGLQTTKIFLGAMYAGLVIAPLNLQAQPAQLTYVIEHSDTKLIFTTKSDLDRLRHALQGVSRPIDLVVLDRTVEDVFPREPLPEIDLPEVSEEDSALLLYTSGTTGLPKGAILTHKSMIAGGLNVTLAHQLAPEDKGLVSLPLYHINAEIVSAMGPLVSGSSIVMPERFSSTEFWALISDYQCTWFSVVPTIISFLVSGTEIGGKNYKLEQVRFGRSASSALPPPLHKAFEEKFKISIVETMGLTECAAPVFSNPLEPSKRKYGSPGQAVGNEAKVVDKHGAECVVGVIGEILIRGDNVMKEYYKAAELTKDALDADGWFRTGDLGYVDKDGFLLRHRA